MNLLLRIALACAISTLLSLSALAATLPWSQLTPTQQEALAPLSNEWNALPESQQQHFIKLAKRYPKLDPVQKQRLHERLARWGKLTPEQRKNARDKFQAFSKVPIKDREQVKQMLRQQEAEEAEEMAVPAASDVPSPAR